MTDMRGASQGLNLVDSVYERLLSERIIFLGSQVDDDIANRLCAQILLLSAEDPTITAGKHTAFDPPSGAVLRQNRMIGPAVARKRSTA